MPGGVWTPFARIAYDTAGNLIPETTLFQLQFVSLDPSEQRHLPDRPAGESPVVGTSIPAGEHGLWRSGPELMSARVVDIVFDPAQSSGIRARASFDQPAGAPQIEPAPLDYPAGTGTITDVAAQVDLALPSSP